jgi:hypothetical protein
MWQVMSRAVVAVVALAVLVASPGVVTAVVGVLDDGGEVVSDVTAGVSDAGAATADGSVAVTTGSQLSTVLSTTEDEVGTEVSRSAFDDRFATANESERAALVAERADRLAREAASVADEYREATAAYENGTTDRSTYARRLATLNGRAQTLRAGVDHLRDRAAAVSALELATVGYDETTLDDASDDLDRVTSAGTSAIHRRFTGQSTGSVAVDTANGSSVSIEVENERGERSREFRSPGDGDGSLAVGGEDALGTAREALSDREWTHRGTTVHGASGVYTFEFVLASANLTGEAEVRVDGSSGTVVRLEEEIEPRDDDDADDEDEDHDEDEDEERPPLALLVTGGEPAPGATVTLQVRRASSPAANVTVFVDDERVGTTDDRGRIDVTLGAGETEVTAGRSDREAELEFEFDDEAEDRPVEGLNLTATLEDGTVTVSVTYRGDGVPGAQVFADGDRVGPTGPDGTTSFARDGTGDLELEITRGELEVERTYHVEDGTLVPGESDRDDETKNEDRNDEADELSIAVVEGEPAPGATVTLAVTADGEPTPGVRVFVDDERVGTTDDDGRVAVTLGAEETDISAQRGDREAELEFEFDEKDDGDENDDDGDEGDGDESDGNESDGDGDDGNRDDGDADDSNGDDGNEDSGPDDGNERASDNNDSDGNDDDDEDDEDDEDDDDDEDGDEDDEKTA